MLFPATGGLNDATLIVVHETIAFRDGIFQNATDFAHKRFDPTATSGQVADVGGTQASFHGVGVAGLTAV